MVKLIPDRINQEIKSNAERKLFLEFRSYRTQDTYLVLHSLGLAEHLDNVFGEIDFVVICSEGILCLEVKGGVVSRDAGIWTFTNRFGETTRKNTGPFQQVQGNMHSLRNYLKNRLGENDALIRCQFACAVLMPDCSFFASDPEVIENILFDRKSNWTLGTIIDKSFDYWRRICRERHQFEGKRLSEDEIVRLGNLLRGDFGSVPALRSRIDSVSNEIYHDQLRDWLCPDHPVKGEEAIQQKKERNIEKQLAHQGNAEGPASSLLGMAVLLTPASSPKRNGGEVYA